MLPQYIPFISSEYVPTRGRPVSLMKCLLFLVVFYMILDGTKGQPPCKEIIKGNTKKARRFWTTEDVTIHYGNESHYRLIKRIGKGGFGEVYLAKNIQYDTSCVVKLYMKAVEMDSMVKEIAILQSLCGGPNIVRVYDVLYLSSTQTPAVVMEHVKFKPHYELYPRLTPADIQFYMKNLLLSLHYLHSHGIIHRDIKPHNYLINHVDRESRLIDFGASAFYYPGTDHNVSGTYLYMAPEALLLYPKQTPKVDIWSFGVMLAGLVFKREYIFSGDSRNKQLEQYSMFFGTDSLLKLLDDYGIDYPRNISAFAVQRPAKNFKQLITSANKHIITEEILEVLNKTLIVDPKMRISAIELMKLPYFHE